MKCSDFPIMKKRCIFNIKILSFQMMKLLVLVAVIAYASADSSEHGVSPGSRGTTCNCGWANRVRNSLTGFDSYEQIIMQKIPYVNL